MASESNMVRQIKARIEALPNTHIKKLWSTATTRDVDLLIVTHGLAGFYEIKVPGEQPTDWQRNRLEYWRAAGADVAWFDSVDACVLHVQQLSITGAQVQEYLRMQRDVDKAVLDTVLHGHAAVSITLPIKKENAQAMIYGAQPLERHACGCKEIAANTWVLCTGHENRLTDILHNVVW